MIINKANIAKYSVLPIPTNFDYTEVMNFVDIAEKIHILPLIGIAMYDELQQEIDDNNLTPENATLLVEAIWPLLGFAIVYESLPSIWAHASSVGLTLGESDNSKSLTLKDLTYYQDFIKRQLQARGDYALEWIKDRIEYYPLIAQCTSCKCSCQPKSLYKPKSFQQLYSPRRRNTDIR